MTLLSKPAALEWLRAAAGPHDVARDVAAWASATSGLGPATSERRLLEILESLFAPDLGYLCTRRHAHAAALSPEGVTVLLVAQRWQGPLALTSRATLASALEAEASWIAGFNGSQLGLADARAGMPRRMALFETHDLATGFDGAQLVAALLHASAVDRGALADAVRFSDDSSRELRHGLRNGVEQSLASLAPALPFDAAVALLFRMLFILFAEARSLVPTWNAAYRDHYSLSSVARDGAAGTWAALEASRRLLHDGCRTRSLQLTGFNGRLFAGTGPRKWAASARLDSRLDAPASSALDALVAYHPARGGARRVNYAELDVEELGTIYERVLDLDPSGAESVRKETGSFYTPRALTDFVIRRALAPVVDGRSSSELLALRIVDPAMGSGAFLVAALRYLAGALERAMIEEGALPQDDVTEADREQIRRTIAQHCLYGVDVNPGAVMLARLSLWLATLSSQKPLTFLDAKLKCGNSLAGIDPATATRAPGRLPVRTALPLFDAGIAGEAMRHGAEEANAFNALEEESVEAVRRKEKRWIAMSEDPAGTANWRRLCDAWCAWWFDRPANRPDAREYGAMADAIVHGASVLPARTLARRLHEAAAVAAKEHFFHWSLEFPEVFVDRGGFDAVIGNPPWEMLRGGDARTAFKTFAKESGLYGLMGGGHINLYQLFLDRAMALTKPGGRIGMVVPWGLMSDEGSAALRRGLLTQTRLDTLARFDNATLIFQAHRSLRFAVMTATTGLPSDAIPLRPVFDGANTLAELPDRGSLPGAITVRRDALEALSGPALRIPDVQNERQLAIAMKIARSHAPLGSVSGWNAAFGRELNLTDDRRWFSSSGMPVLEGKHLHPFRVDGDARHRISAAAATRLLPGRPFDRARLAYRDVTAPTNTQTLIAAIVPAGAVTSHSLFCLRNRFNDAEQRALCAIFNSGVANFLMRLFVGAHVTTSLIEWLPVPERRRTTAALGAAALRDDWQVVVAELYGLEPDELESIGAEAKDAVTI